MAEFKITDSISHIRWQIINTAFRASLPFREMFKFRSGTRLALINGTYAKGIGETNQRASKHRREKTDD